VVVFTRFKTERSVGRSAAGPVRALRGPRPASLSLCRTSGCTQVEPRMGKWRANGGAGVLELV